jgi:hypothetical protein
MELRNEIFRLERLEKQLAKRQWKKAEETDSLERLPALVRIAEHLKSASETVYALEDRILLALYGKTEFEKEPLTDALAAASGDWRELLLSVCSWKQKAPDYSTVAMFSENSAFLFELARAYYNIGLAAGAKVSVIKFQVAQAGDEGFMLLGRVVTNKKVDKPEAFFATPIQTVVGVGLAITSRFASLEYGPERGVHTFVDKQKSHKVLVDTSEIGLMEYKPPVGIDKRAGIDHQPRRRAYNYDKSVIEDVSLKSTFPFHSRAIDRALASACEERMMRDAKAILESE